MRSEIVGINKFLSWKRFDNFLAMPAAAGIYRQVSSNHLGKPHLCLALEPELMTVTGQGWFLVASASTCKGGLVQPKEYLLL